ncbi:hypothetical protein [Streptomyces sp. NPDC054787]
MLRVLAAALPAAACGAHVEPGGAPGTRPRMEQVAAAWEGSAALRQ